MGHPTVFFAEPHPPPPILPRTTFRGVFLWCSENRTRRERLKHARLITLAASPSASSICPHRINNSRPLWVRTHKSHYPFPAPLRHARQIFLDPSSVMRHLRRRHNRCAHVEVPRPNQRAARRWPAGHPGRVWLEPQKRHKASTLAFKVWHLRHGFFIITPAS